MSIKDNVVIYSTENSRYFADLIAKRLGLKVSEIIRDTFGDGEKYYRIGINDRFDLVDKFFIFVGSSHTDADLLEIFRIGCTAAACGTLRRIFVIPFYGHSTQERQIKPGEAATAATDAMLLSAIPNSGLGNIFLMLDLHVSGIREYFKGDGLPFELYAGDTLVEVLRQKNLNSYQFGSADLGRPKWVRFFAKKLGDGSIVLVDKDRNFKESEVKHVIGDVEDKDIIMYDDMGRSFVTICKAVQAYLNRHANSVSAVLSHLAIYGDDIVEKIENSPLQSVITTNSHPMSQLPSVQNSNKIEVIDVSPAYAKAITSFLRIGGWPCYRKSRSYS